MDETPKAPRTEVELYALMLAMERTRGAVPAWLARELEAPADPFTTPSPQARRSQAAFAACLASLCCAVWLGATLEAGAAPAPRLVFHPAPIDWDAKDAIGLAQDFRLAGDDDTVLSRLGGVTRHAEGRAWSAEKTAEDTYLVVYREPAGYPAYAFEVNLETEQVAPTPEAVEALTARRVRDASETLQMVADTQPVTPSN